MKPAGEWDKKIVCEIIDITDDEKQCNVKVDGMDNTITVDTVNLYPMWKNGGNAYDSGYGNESNGSNEMSFDGIQHPQSVPLHASNSRKDWSFASTVDFKALPSSHPDGSDLPKNLATVRFFYNYGIDAYSRRAQESGDEFEMDTQQNGLNAMDAMKSPIPSPIPSENELFGFNRNRNAGQSNFGNNRYGGKGRSRGRGNSRFMNRPRENFSDGANSDVMPPPSPTHFPQQAFYNQSTEFGGHQAFIPCPIMQPVYNFLPPPQPLTHSLSGPLMGDYGQQDQLETLNVDPQGFQSLPPPPQPIYYFMQPAPVPMQLFPQNSFN